MIKKKAASRTRLRMATAKSVLSNRCDTIWDIYVSEEFAVHKGPVPNNLHSFPN